MSGTPTITAADLKRASRPDYIGMLIQQLAPTLARGISASRECRFHAQRKWRVDLVLSFTGRGPIAVECEGGLHVQGRHSRGVGMEKDMEKYAELTIAGYRLLRVSPRQIKNGQAAAWIRRLLEA